jgi:drug/metabolite transporter (DMT)-like permease
LLTGLHGGDFSRVGFAEGIALAGAFAAALVVVVIRQLTLTETSGTIFASQCFYAGLLALPFLFTLPLPGITDVALLTASALMAALGQLAMTEGFRFLPVSTGGAIQMLLPLVLTVAGVLFFAEPFSLVQGAGAACILAGCHLVVAQRSR